MTKRTKQMTQYCIRMLLQRKSKKSQMEAKKKSDGSQKKVRRKPKQSPTEAKTKSELRHNH